MVRQDDVRLDLVDDRGASAVFETTIGVLEVPHAGIGALRAHDIDLPDVLLANDDTAWLSGVARAPVLPAVRPNVFVRCQVIQLQDAQSKPGFLPRQTFSIEGDPEPFIGRDSVAYFTAIERILDSNTPIEELRSYLDGDNDFVRQRTCSDAALPTELLSALANEDDFNTRKAVAENPRVSQSIASRLATDPDYRVRAALGANPALPMDLLVKLSRDARGEVRGSIAANPAVPAPILEELVRDSDWKARCGAAQNEHLSDAAWTALAHDIHPDVAARIAGNPASPADVLRELAWSFPFVVAQNSHAPTDVLTRLGETADVGLRRQVARNRATPPKLLKTLAHDNDPSVLWEVRDNPSSPDNIRRRLKKRFPD
jgi:hypothetical protein